MRRVASIVVMSLVASVGAQVAAADRGGVDAGVRWSPTSRRRRQVRPSAIERVVRVGPDRRARWARDPRDPGWVRHDRAGRRWVVRDGRQVARPCSNSAPNSAAVTMRTSPRCAACWRRSAARKWTTTSWRSSVAGWPKRPEHCRRRTSSSRRFASRRAPSHARLVTPFARTTDVLARGRQWAARRRRSHSNHRFPLQRER